MEFTCSLGRKKQVSDIQLKAKKLFNEIFCKSNKKN